MVPLNQIESRLSAKINQKIIEDSLNNLTEMTFNSEMSVPNQVDDLVQINKQLLKANFISEDQIMNAGFMSDCREPSSGSSLLIQQAHINSI